MDYKEKYEQALERASKLRVQNPFDTVGQMVEHIFPELQESEDELTRKSLIRFLRSPFVHENITDEKVAPWIAWLEKQGEQQGKSALEAWKDMRLEVYQQASGNRHEPNYSDDTTKMFSLNDIDEIIEKMSEQKPTDKVESKFKVGDWVILNGTVAQILDKQKYGFVGLDIDGKDFFCNHGHSDSMRLWTINDAKDGDVLVTEDYIFIFKYILRGGVHIYCHYNFDDEEFDVDIPDAVIGNIHDKGIHFRPAAKEQHDLLFSKMKEDGYEWDADKKEFQKITLKFFV